MKKIRRWFLVGLFFLLGLEILTIAPRHLGKHDEKKAQEKKTSPIATTNQIMRGVKAVKGLGDVKEYELEADYAQDFKEKGTWKLSGVTTRYFGANDVSYKVTGDTGTVHHDSRDMEMNGHIVMQTSDGYVMKTDSLQFTAKKKELATEDPIFIVGPKTEGLFEVNAVGFMADMNTNMMYLRKNVKAVRSVGKGKEMNIKSQSAMIEANTNVAHFYKNVQTDLESIRMTGRQADFIFDQKSGSIKSMVMQGDVRVTDREHMASSEKAEFIFDRNEFILSGNPKVIQNDNELRGEEIRLINGGKEVKVYKARARVENEKGDL